MVVTVDMPQKCSKSYWFPYTLPTITSHFFICIKQYKFWFSICVNLFSSNFCLRVKPYKLHLEQLKVVTISSLFAKPALVITAHQALPVISSKPATTCNSRCRVIILLSRESVSWDSPFPTSESKQQKCKKGHIHHELSSWKYLQNIVQSIYFVKSVDKLGPKWSLDLRVSNVRKRSAFSSTLTWLLYTSTG